MSDLDQRLRSLAETPVPAPSGVHKLVGRVHRLRRRRRVVQATGAGLTLVLVAGLGVTVAELVSRPSVLLGPGEEQTEIGVPEGWQTITAGGAALSVPADWPVTQVRMPGPMPHPEHIFRGGPAAYVADQFYTPTGPPAEEDAPPRSAGVYAYPAHRDPEHLRWLEAEGDPITTNGHQGRWAATEEFRWYAFPDLDALLWISYEPDPALMERVLATLRRAAGPGDEPPADTREGIARADTPEGVAAIEVVVERDVLRPDEPVRFHLVNRGDVIVRTGRPFGVERWNGQTWQPVPLSPLWPSDAMVLPPDATAYHQQWPGDNRLPMEPGWYRVAKAASYHHPEQAPTEQELEARTRFQIVDDTAGEAQPNTGADGPRHRDEPSELVGARWTGPDGEVVSTRTLNVIRGPEHCDWQASLWMHIGWPLGTQADTAADIRQYLRDPQGVLPDGTTPTSLDTDAQVPESASPTAYEAGDVQLWLGEDGGQNAVYVVFPDHAERWPRATEVFACA